MNPIFSDEHWMAQAIALAKKGQRTTTPNPNVGCVIVKDGVLVGSGFHYQAGTPHAEVHALAEAKDNAAGATAYVTLEPCSHFGRTPPCAEALIAAGVARVVCAMMDPNPLVSGQGVGLLASAGIEVVTGVLAESAEALNPGFLQRMRTGMPFVTLKMASSLDGGTALASGESQWITGPQARQDVQQWRAKSCAIVTGVGTVVADDPLLNVRLPGQHRQPVRIILDARGRTPLDAKMVDEEGDTIIVHGDLLSSAQVSAYQHRGYKTQVMPLVDGQIDLLAFMAWAAQQPYNSLWIEAGATLAGAFVAAKLVNQIVLYQAPMLLGANARPVIGQEISVLSMAHQLNVSDVRFIGRDIRWLLTPLA